MKIPIRWSVVVAALFAALSSAPARTPAGRLHMLFAPQERPGPEFRDTAETKSKEEQAREHPFNGLQTTYQDGHRVETASDLQQRVLAERQYRATLNASLKALDSQPELKALADQALDGLLALQRGNQMPVNAFLENLGKMIRQEHLDPQKKAAEVNLEKFTEFKKARPNGRFELLRDGRGDVLSGLTVENPPLVEAGFNELSTGKRPVYAMEDRTCIACTDFSHGPTRALNVAAQSGRTRIMRMTNQDIAHFTPDLVRVAPSGGKAIIARRRTPDNFDTIGTPAPPSGPCDYPASCTVYLVVPKS